MIKSVFCAYIVEVFVPFIENSKIFSPQKSEASVGSRREIDSVSLNVYLDLLYAVKPAKVTRFSIEPGTLDITVSKQGC
jgi:hypothetical protein